MSGGGIGNSREGANVLKFREKRRTVLRDDS